MSKGSLTVPLQDGFGNAPYCRQPVMCERHQYASHNPAPASSSTSEVTAACWLTILNW